MIAFAATLAAAGMAAAFTATLLDQESLALYSVCAAVAGLGFGLILIHYARRRFIDLAQPEGWAVIAPVGIVLGMLGVAASGASCGAACIAWGAPAASVAMFAPEINTRLRTLRRPRLR